MSKKDSIKMKEQMPIPRDYKHHLTRMKNINPYVDSTPPKLFLSTYMKPTNLRTDNDQVIAITKNNLELLAQISVIKRSGVTNYGKIEPEKMVRGAHLYKLKLIRDIEKHNIILADRILNVKSEVESCKRLNKFWRRILKLLKCMCHFPIVLPDLLESNSLKLNSKYKNYQPLVYLDLGIRNGRPLGRIIILLYLDLAPRTVKNFIDLCENHRNWPIPENLDNDDYEEIDRNCKLIKTTFHRIFTNLFIYGGNLNYDKKIKDFSGIPDYTPESFQFHHGYKGTLSMCPMENGLINSEFTISLKPLDVLNGIRLVFGRVIRGLTILDTVANYGTKNGKPKAIVEITNCGLLKLF